MAWSGKVYTEHGDGVQLLEPSLFAGKDVDEWQCDLGAPNVKRSWAVQHIDEWIQAEYVDQFETTALSQLPDCIPVEIYEIGHVADYGPNYVFRRPWPWHWIPNDAVWVKGADVWRVEPRVDYDSSYEPAPEDGVVAGAPFDIDNKTIAALAISGLLYWAFAKGR